MVTKMVALALQGIPTWQLLGLTAPLMIVAHDSDEVACTGMTGNVYTGSKCSNNPTYNANQGSCEAGSGVFFASTCATCSNGGDASSEFA